MNFATFTMKLTTNIAIQMQVTTLNPKKKACTNFDRDDKTKLPTGIGVRWMNLIFLGMGGAEKLIQ